MRCLRDVVHGDGAVAGALVEALGGGFRALHVGDVLLPHLRHRLNLAQVVVGVHMPHARHHAVDGVIDEPDRLGIELAGVVDGHHRLFLFLGSFGGLFAGFGFFFLCGGVFLCRLRCLSMRLRGGFADFGGFGAQLLGFAFDLVEDVGVLFGGEFARGKGRFGFGADAFQSAEVGAVEAFFQRIHCGRGCIRQALDAVSHALELALRQLVHRHAAVRQLLFQRRPFCR